MEEGGTRLSESPGQGSCVLLLGGEALRGPQSQRAVVEKLLHGGFCHLVGCLPRSPYGSWPYRRVAIGPKE